MFIIGERINGMFKDIGAAVAERNEGVLVEWAKKQDDAAADALDINVGPVKGDAKEHIVWMVETVQKATDTQLCIDTPKYDVMEAALKVCKNKPIMNSTKATEEDLEKYIALAQQYSAELIVLTIDKAGVPSDVETRINMCALIMEKVMTVGMDMGDIFIDPIVFPCNVAPQQPMNVIETIKQLQVLSDPPPRTVVGLSNLSQRCKERALINRTFFAMATAAGLTGAILDPTDTELVDAGITVELLQEKTIYCDDYLAAYRSSK